MSLDTKLKSELSKLIHTGQAFKNPLKANIDIALSINVSLIEDLINLLTDRLVIPRIANEEFDSLYTMETLFINTMNNYKLHTDQLCGVNLDSSKNIYSVLMITQASFDSIPIKAISDKVLKQPITINRFDITNMFPSLSESNPFSKVMGSLKYSSNIFKDVDGLFNLISNIKVKYESETYYQELLLLPEIDRVVDIISNLSPIIIVGNTVSNSIQNQINSDNMEYELAQRIVLSQAITENLVYLTTGINTSEFMDTIQTNIFKNKIPKI